ncbi:MAG: twin-arginine translocation signal domain-containing protein, partial [Sphingobacteriaceae bacterium]
MKNNRRDFLQKAGLIASATGLNLVLPEAASAEFIKKDDKNSIVASANNAVADTTSGKVRGYTHNHIFTFKGVPYGADTSGENRFMPPKKPIPWNEVKDCLVYGPISPQRPD